MTITKRLQVSDPSLTIHDEGEWNGTTSEFMAFNDAGVECEVGEFLYSLVRLLKPEHILETGTHVGIGASYMGMGLKDNKKGHLDTIEFLPEIQKQAVTRIQKMGLTLYVTSHFGDVKDFVPPKDSRGSNGTLSYPDRPSIKYGLILLDTEPQTRYAEFVKFYPYLEEGGFIFIHDLHRHMHQIPNTEHGFAWPFGKIPEFITELVNKGEIKPFHFSTPRGLTGFYKVHSQDYKFIK